MKTKTPPQVLAGDIGGTNTRLGLFLLRGETFRFKRGQQYPSQDYQGLEKILRAFLGRGDKIASACFGVAGPVIGTVVRTTNLPWRIDLRSLRKELDTNKVGLMNDLVANAYGIPVLGKEDLHPLNAGKRREGNAALISAGTGLGEAVLFWDGTQHVPSPSEGGHVDFAPRNDLETGLFQYLACRFGHVSYERILSGTGLFHVYQFLRDTRRYGMEPEWLSREMGEKDPASVISENARRKRNRLCGKALDLFVSIYGAAAGNLALQVLAIGGVYIGGGIAPKIIWKLGDGSFMKAFIAKGRHAGMMGTIPVNVILNEQTALLGAARRAVELVKNETTQS